MAEAGVEAEAEGEPVAEGESDEQEWLRRAAAEDRDEVEEGTEAERERGRKKGRRLEYDEKLGRVVARKQHKQRGRRDWTSEWDE